MSSAGGVAALAAEIGGAGFQHHDPVSVDGVDVAATVRPGDGEALGAAVAAIARLGLAALPRGGGTAMGLGNPPRRADVLISTAALTGVTIPAEIGRAHV